MKSNAILPTLILMALANAGCAKENEPAVNTPKADSLTTAQTAAPPAPAPHNPVYTQLLDERALLVTNKQQAGIASLFSTQPVSSDIMANWVVRILLEQGASDVFVQKLTPRLKMNPRLKKDTFSLPIIDEQGKEHLFELISDTETRFYTLNYRGKLSSGE